MKQGYLALHRKIQNHPFYKEKREFSKYEAWVDILMEVQHCLEPKDVVLGMNVFKCQYGESLKSIKTWSKRWGWTESKVRRYFVLLEKMNQIRTKSEVKTTRLFVINYESYDPKRRVADEQSTSNRSASDEQSTTDNKDKNENNVNNEKNLLEQEFEKFWDMYQKKKDRPKCFTKWKKLKEKDKQIIFETLPAYVKSTPDKQYRKNPYSYLNGNNWDDEITNNTKMTKNEEEYEKFTGSGYYKKSTTDNKDNPLY